MTPAPSLYSSVSEAAQSARSPSSVIPCHTGPGRRLFRTEIAWRFTSAIVCGCLLVIIIFAFEKMGELKASEKRGFNALTILFSALMSLSLGSLLGLLGGMLRWPLLAWEDHTPLEVSSTSMLI